MRTAKQVLEETSINGRKLSAVLLQNQIPILEKALIEFANEAVENFRLEASDFLHNSYYYEASNLLDDFEKPEIK